MEKLSNKDYIAILLFILCLLLISVQTYFTVKTSNTITAFIENYDIIIKNN